MGSCHHEMYSECQQHIQTKVKLYIFNKFWKFSTFLNFKDKKTINFFSKSVYDVNFSLNHHIQKFIKYSSFH